MNNTSIGRDKVWSARKWIPVKGIAVTLAPSTQGENLRGLVKQVGIHSFVDPVDGERDNLIGVNGTVGGIKFLRPF